MDDMGKRFLKILATVGILYFAAFLIFTSSGTNYLRKTLLILSLSSQPYLTYLHHLT